ncbi:MAG: hypothetical protein JWL77_4381 [Chthonomonadaceae bacterium]|nr:hypothetical protein [Chthonomonadaceae bacterium]
MNSEDESSAYLMVKVKRLVKEERDLKQAVAKFSALGDEAIPILCALVEAESIFGKRRCWALIGVLVSCSAMDLLLILFLPRGTRDIYQVLLHLLHGGGALGLMLSIPCGWRATRLLAALDDARLVGQLLDSLFTYSRDASITDAIRRALTRLLPRLHASDGKKYLAAPGRSRCLRPSASRK